MHDDALLHDDLALPPAPLPPSVRSRVAERIVRGGDPLARLRAGAALELYYETGDAHSQLCAALARSLLERLRIPLRIRLVPAPDAQAYPEAERQRRFAVVDASRLAPCHGLPAPVVVPEDQRDAMEARLAAAGSDARAFLEAERHCLQAIAHGERLGAARNPSTEALLEANARRRRRLGHYLPAMWQYRGEWFWALDRLRFLQARLEARGALDGAAPLLGLDPARLPADRAAPGTPLEFWFSFRSPYSYLAAVALLRRRQRGLHANVMVRPVLPMVMRGLPVPRAKRLYIVRDVKRCADALGIPFGRIHDPLGAGALRLLTAYPHQAAPDVQLRYCALAGQAVWAEGLDVCRDDALRSVIERSGLDWDRAQAKLAQGTDTRAAEAHREALFAAGLWGVPSFRLGRFTTWGQDRLWMLDRVADVAMP